MTILTFPLIIPTRAGWGLKSITEAFASPLNGAVQTAGRPGSRWKALLEFAAMDLTQGATLDGFLGQMDGMNGRVNLYPHHRPGTGATAVVNGGGQVGTTLACTCVALRAFAIGDFFSVNGELKMIVVPIAANGAGAVTLTFTPMLRASPSNGATLVFTQPTTVMMLNQDEYAVTRVPGPEHDTISIPLIEVFS